MDREMVRALYDRQERRDAVIPGLRREAAAGVVRQVDPAGVFNTVLYSDLAPDTVERAIQEQIGYFRDLHMGFEWKLYGHDGPVDLGDRLAAIGLRADEMESVMVLDLEENSALLSLPLHPGVRRIAEPEGLSAVAAVQEAVWGRSSPDMMESFARDLVEHPESLSFYVVEVDGTPVSSARISYTPGSDFAGLWGGSTDPRFRGQGLYTALVAARAREASGRGRRYLTVDAGSMSAPILGKLGFEDITTARAYTWSPAPGATD
jgi:GNAT superfamily N-acetyltransferase